MASLDVIPQHIIVTLPNGVSFELVAGACCVVDFVNGQKYTDNYLYGQKSPLTLNINSTGAKYFGGRYGGNGNMVNANTSATFRSGSGNSSLRGTLVHIYESLCCYNGTVYIMHITEPPLTGYNDYGDS